MLNYPDLFGYFKKARVKLWESLEKLSQEQLVDDRGLSFNSIKDVLVHTIMVEDNWLHYRYAGLGPNTKHTFQDFKSLADVRPYMNEVDTKTAKLFSNISPSDFKKQVKRTSADGTTQVYTLEQILYHIPIEVIYHYGEIFAEFWKMNIDAPYYSYLAYSTGK